MRISVKKLNESLKKQIVWELAQTLTNFKDPQQTLVFLNDFLNTTELETFAKRLAIAYWLKKGRSYNNIKDNLKVSNATIATVQETLNTSGMKLAIKDLEAEEWANKWSEKIKGMVKK
ncbi:MAG: Trp family transcriptional regulator [Patescibacteria group bacterium]